MQIIEVTGGRPLCGTVRPPAAKNSVLPLLAASLLCGAPCSFLGVPALTDVATSLALLRACGARAERHAGNLYTYPVPDEALHADIPAHLAGAMRSSVFYLAPLLCRVGWVRLPLPGGCRLGPRPVDIHLAGLTALGATVELEGEAITLRRPAALHGADFTLRLPSVGATLTLLMAACSALGVTVLRGAACEPEIADVANFLSACGAKIVGAGTPTIVVQGGESLDGAVHTPLPDRIVAATYAAAVTASGGEVTIVGCPPALYAPFLDFLKTCGVCVRRRGRTATLTRCPDVPLKGGVELCANVWPAFATDTAPLAAAVLLAAKGESTIYDSLFANRFACAAGFAALGAACRSEGRTLHIPGDAALQGASLEATDLRGGAALLVAALAAKGKTLLRDAGHIRRGYADLPGDLRALGACCVEKGG